MVAYPSKEALISEIKKNAALFIKEFDEIPESEKNMMIEAVDRTPQEMIAYQLGWINLMLKWDQDELAGKKVMTPAPEYKWNQLGGLYQSFYDQYRQYSLQELKEVFSRSVEEITLWVNGFKDDELFHPGGRAWASSTPSNWPIWKWVHINTVAPFKTFRGKIRKWKRLKAVM